MTDDHPTSAPAKRSALSRLAGNLALLGVAVLVSLVLAELLLRVMGVAYIPYYETDPLRGVAHLPGAKSRQQFNGHPFIEISHDGLRGPDVPLAHPPGTLRIALLGDSYIEAFQVPFEQTVGEVIARRLSAARGQPVQVLNFGVGGYGTAQELITLRHEVWKYSPDLVLLAVTTGNDISDNSRALKGSDYVPYYAFKGPSLVLDTSFLKSREYRSRSFWRQPIPLALLTHSRLVQMANYVRRTRRKLDRREENASAVAGEEVGLRDKVMVPPADPDWQEAWRVTETLLGMVRDECRSRHTPLAIVTLTRAVQVTPVPERKVKFMQEIGATDLYYPERRLDEFGRREGIPVFNLAQPMAALALQRHVFFHSEQGQIDAGHWNAEGHRVAGELTGTWLAGLLADTARAVARP